VEQASNLIVSDRLAHCNALRHNRGVVVLDLPNAIFFDIVVGVTSYIEDLQKIESDY
jgi:hypothetical protein